MCDVSQRSVLTACWTATLCNNTHYTCFTLWKNAQVPTEQEAGWARDLVWKLCRSGKSPDPVKCAYWLHRWYKSCSSFSFLLNSTALLNNRSEKRKSTAPGAIQVRNWWKAIGTEEELDEISRLRKGWMKCYIYRNVRLAYSTILTVRDNAGRKHSVWKENICVARLTRSYQNEPYQKCMMWAPPNFNTSKINKYIIQKCMYTVYKCIYYIHQL